MKISTRYDSGVAIMSLKGKLTIGEGDISLRDELLATLDKGHKKVIIDVTGVSFVDSAGLGELVRCKATVAGRDGEVRLVGVQEKLRNLLLMTKLIGVFDAYDSEKEALAAFA
jgi:anti-sigma B factor antagonist